jgi:hypothetical protein
VFLAVTNSRSLAVKGIGAVVSSLDKSGRLSGSRVGIVELVELTRGKEIVVV